LGRGKWLADLFSLARLCLKTAGIENVYGGEVCTYTNPRLYYSHRRDYDASAKPGKRHTGRFATVIWLGQ
jgi:copper oxidase (laccase) domain-containing protein